MGANKSRDEQREKTEKKIEKPKVESKPKRKLIEGVRGIIRLAEVDLPGEKKVRHAILHIKGVSHSLAHIVPQLAGIDPNVMVGSLTDEQLDKLEDVVRNPQKYGVPIFMLNRRNDLFLGGDRHLVSSDLTMQQKADIDFMKKIRAYRGIRHELGLPVRGQRTRSSFRTGVRVGVVKGAAREQAKAAPAAKPGAPAGKAPVTAPAAKEATKPEAKKEVKK